MAANRLRLTSFNLLNKYSACNTYRVRKSLYCTKNSGNEESGSENLTGFARFAFKQNQLDEPEKPAEESSEPTSESLSGFARFASKQKEFLDEPEKPTKESHESFVSLLRNSNFMALGDPIGKIVIGKIYHVVGNDLYIDFGWKFPTVCAAPNRNREFYVVGSKVKLLIKDLELSAKFLGGEEEITLCEADCVLLGLVNRPSTIATKTDENFSVNSLFEYIKSDK